MALPLPGVRRARRLEQTVVVITGASSGIGRAAAFAFAERGANVVLVARRGEALEELARECEAYGVAAMPIATDMRDEGAVRELGRQVYQRFGRIDTWVNNAAVSLFGRLEETPIDVYLAVFETNMFGYIHGARAALARFREQGSGVLINVSSVIGTIGQPHTSAYVNSKWAIRGFSQSLRMELALDEAHDIHVCAVLPAAIDTPLFQQAGNYLGRVPRPLQPTYDARMVAERIVDVAARPRAEVYAGDFGRLAALKRIAMPEAAERTFARMVDREHFRGGPVPPTPGNVLEAQPGWASIDGGWRSEQGNGSIGLAARLVIPSTLIMGAGALAWRLRTRRR